MTQEEKAKAYDKALERAMNFIENGDITEKTIAESIFHGLIENKDEKIRKEIINIFKSLGDGKIPTTINYADIFTWLEKQGEQKPAWSEEDRDYYDAIIAKLEVTQDDAALTDNQMEFLKSLKDRVQIQPKQWKPSEEQLEVLDVVLTDKTMYEMVSKVLKELRDQLKAL